jgi:hypothetical protein
MPHGARRPKRTARLGGQNTTRTVHDLRGVEPINANLIMAVGDESAVLRMDPANPATYNTPSVMPSGTLHAVRATGNALHVAADAGRIWYCPDITATTPAFTALNLNTGAVRALGTNTTQVTAVGDQALVHNLFGTTRMVVHELYTPPLRGIWTNDGLVAYAVGEANTVRATTNGGLSWQVVPLGGTRRAMLSVHGNEQGRTFAVGANCTAIDLADPLVPIAIPGCTGTTELRDVAVTPSGAVAIAAATGSTGKAFLRDVESNWQTQSHPQPLNTVWPFPRYVADAAGLNNEVSYEDLLFGGNERYLHFARFVPFTDDFEDDLEPNPPPPPAAQQSTSLTGHIRDLWFHDQVNGFALMEGAGGTALYRTEQGTGAMDHGSHFDWQAVPHLHGDQATTTVEANVEPLCLAFSDRTHGFVGGAYNGTPTGFARTLTDEGGLYSQRFWYDALGRLVLSQNSKQFNMATQRFSYSLYDELGRVYEAGELEDDGSAPDRFQDLPSTDVNGALLPNVLDPEVLKDWVLNRPRYEVTRTQYDVPLFDLDVPGFVQDHLRLRVASTMYFDEWYDDQAPDSLDYDHATHYSYDIHGNVKTLVQDHPQLGIDGGAIQTNCTGCVEHRYKRMDYTYDLISGNVRQVDYQKDQPDALHHRYTYDADNRITEVETSADAQNWHTDARYFYYPHGPLQRVELGEHLVQGTDYAYTLQGWLKGINSDRLKPENDMGLDGWNDPSNPNLLVGRDAFGFSLNYHGDADYTAINSARWDNTTGERAFAPMGGDMATTWSPLYNGNIAHTVNSLQPFGLWSSPSEQGQVLAQVYQYDQLNRLRASRGYVGLDADNDWAQAGATVAHMYKSTYAYDANGNITQAHRWDQHGDHYDSLHYHYQSASGRLMRNRLYQLQDLAADNVVTLAADGVEDLPNATAGFTDPTGALGTINTANNYSYDALGNLIRDAREQIGAIEWTVAGKVKSIARTLGSTRKPLLFAYGASGQRTMKQVGVPDGTDAEAYREHYIRDAQGNIMATYRYTNNAGASLKLNERPLYGSSRLGSMGKEVELHTLAVFDPAGANPVQQVDLNYELTDHLGNVCAVVTGRLLDGNGGGTAKQAELVSAQGYEPFGALLPGRNYSSSSYRFGFNSQEKVDEMHGAAGTHYSAQFWEMDPRIGRRWERDPVMKFHESPYAILGNNPIWFVDLNGADSTLYSSKDGSFIDRGTSPQDDKTAIWTVDPTAENYDASNPWKTASRLTYQVGAKTEERGVTGKHFRKNHPLAGKGYKVGDQVYEEDLMDMTKEFNGIVSTWRPYFSSYRKSEEERYKKSWGYLLGAHHYHPDEWMKVMFIGMVAPDMPFDLKSMSRKNEHAGTRLQIPSYAAIVIGEYSFYSGRLMNYDDYGNAAFGAWGKSYGYGISTLLEGADWDQFFHTGRGDPGRDQYFIRLGFNMYR